jgi:hypothetical protein
VAGNRPAIIVMGYDRPASLRRLLSSLAQADYEGYSDIPLVISVDGGGPSEVGAVAEDFTWSAGPKRVIRHKCCLGLREHITVCGGLSQEYGSIIILEDDIYVSPVFYHYAASALNFYQDDPATGRISLQTSAWVNSVLLPLQPLQDGGDVIFRQSPGSWGVAWTATQWQEFRAWCGDGYPTVTDEDGLPKHVVNWPDSSWAKIFAKYLVECNRYVVYPRVSLTANFCDPGVHYQAQSRLGQYQLAISQRKFRFRRIDDSIAVYDSYGELLPDSLNRLCPHLREYDYAVDLYGVKELSSIRQEYLLTTRKPTDHVLSFAREMTPMEQNVISNLPGTGIWLCEKRYIEEGESCKMDLVRRHIQYFYPEMRWVEDPVTGEPVPEFGIVTRTCEEKEEQIQVLKYRLDALSGLLGFPHAIRELSRAFIMAFLRLLFRGKTDATLCRIQSLVKGDSSVEK